MRAIVIAFVALTVGIAGNAFGQSLPPSPSTFSLIGMPVNSSPASVTLPIQLQVSLNPTPLPPVPDPNANLNLTDPTNPIYSYPAFEIEDFSFDIEQTLSIGSSSNGAGAGKVTFNPFQITNTAGDTVDGKFNLVDVDENQILETFTVDIAGIDTTNTTNPLTSSTQIPVTCNVVPCAYEALSFIGIGPDPVVSFSVSNGTTNFAFSTGVSRSIP